MARKTILDNWLETTKEENLGLNNLRDRLIQLSDPQGQYYRTVYLKVPGSNPRAKATNLITMWAPVQTTTTINPPVKEVFDSRAIVPIGTEFYTIPHSKSGKYHIVSIQDENRCRIAQRQGYSNEMSYNLEDLNRHISNGIWKVVNPTEEVSNNIKNFKFKSRHVIFSKFRIVSTNDSLSTFYRVTLSSGSSFTISQSPTGNCQLACIGYLETLISYFTKDELINQFKEIRSVGKKILLADIHDNHVNKLKEIIPNNIISSTPYKSTNGSQMNIVLINIDKL